MFIRKIWPSLDNDDNDNDDDDDNDDNDDDNDLSNVLGYDDDDKCMILIMDD